MTLRLKIQLAQVPMLTALLLVSGLAVWTYVHLGQLAHEMLVYNHNSVRAVLGMTESLERINRAGLLRLLEGNRQPDQDLDRFRQQFEAALRLQEQSSLEGGEAEATTALALAWGRLSAELLAFRAATDDQEARDIYFKRLLPAAGLVGSRLQPVLEINQRALTNKSQRVGDQTYSFLMVVVACAALALLLGAAATLTLSGRMLSPLTSLAKGVQLIAAGDFAARVPQGGKDEVGQLAGEINAMAGHLQEYRQQARDELSLARRATLAAINSLPDPVLVLDLDGRVVNLNHSAQQLLLPGCDPTAARAGSFQPVVSACLLNLLNHVRQTREAYSPKGFHEAVKVRFSEGERYLLPRAFPVEDPESGLAGFTVLLQDVTRPRRLDQMKDDLVATVAHEFRTPLTSLHMAVLLCLDQVAGPVSPKQRELLSAARQDCERVQALVDDILDLSRMEQAAAVKRLRPVAAAQLMDLAQGLHATDARQNGVEIMVAAAPGETVLADPDRVSLVFANLIANAIRHTPPGGQVTLSAQREGGLLRFTVADDGGGHRP